MYIRNFFSINKNKKDNSEKRPTRETPDGDFGDTRKKIPRQKGLKSTDYESILLY